MGRARRVVAGWRLAGRHLLSGAVRAGLRRPARVRTSGKSLPLPGRARKLAGRRVAGRSGGSRPGPGKARARRLTRDEAGAVPRSRNTARALAGETAAVRPGNGPGSLVSVKPWARALTRRARRLLERVLAERVVAVLLSLRRAARVGAVLRRRVLLAALVLVALVLVSLVRRAVPRPARAARGHARVRSAVARSGVALTSEPRRAVSARRAATWPRREGSATRRERGTREPRSGPPAGTGSAAALATALPRPGAAIWPRAGLGVRLPAPPP